MHALKGVSMYRPSRRKARRSDAAVDEFVVEALFATLTNVNFDPVSVCGSRRTGRPYRDRARALYLDAAAAKGLETEHFNGVSSSSLGEPDGLIAQGKTCGVVQARVKSGVEVANLQS